MHSPRPRLCPPPGLSPGRRIGPYRIIELRYEGGFACLYRATAARSGRTVALKVLHRHLLATPQALARLELEARALNQLAHPHIVEVLDCGQLPGGLPFIAMEWLDGPNLDEELRRGGPLSATRALAVMEEVGSALGAAHARGIVHRDVKAENIVVVPRRSSFTTKLVDFGIAKLLDRDAAGAELTTSRQVVGTPATMAPEQILGQPVDPRTDIYALGLLLFQLLTGRLPFQGRSIAETEELHLSAPVPRVSDVAGVPLGVDAVLRRSLEKVPERRPARVDQLLAELRRALVARSVPARQLSVGVHVQARLGAVPDELAGDALDELGAALLEAHGALEAAGLTVVVETADAVLATAPLPEIPRDGLRVRRSVLQAALALSGALAARARHLRLEVTAHVASTSVHLPRGRAVLGGELLHVCEWTAGHPGGGLVASAPMMAGLDEEFLTMAHPRRPGAVVLLGAPAVSEAGCGGAGSRIGASGR